MPLPAHHNYVYFMQDEMIAETTKVKKGRFSAAAGVCSGSSIQDFKRGIFVVETKSDTNLAWDILPGHVRVSS